MELLHDFAHANKESKLLPLLYDIYNGGLSGTADSFKKHYAPIHPSVKEFHKPINPVNKKARKSKKSFKKKKLRKKKF